MGGFIFWVVGECAMITGIVYGVASIAADVGSEWAKIDAVLRGERL